MNKALEEFLEELKYNATIEDTYNVELSYVIDRIENILANK